MSASQIIVRREGEEAEAAPLKGALAAVERTVHEAVGEHGDGTPFRVTATVDLVGSVVTVLVDAGDPAALPVAQRLATKVLDDQSFRPRSYRTVAASMDGSRLLFVLHAHR